MTTRAEEIAGEEYPDTTGPDGETIYMEGQRQVFVKGYKQGQQDRWIPVSERLPGLGPNRGQSDSVLVAIKDEFFEQVGLKVRESYLYEVNNSSGRQLKWDGITFAEVIYWQPLPPVPEVKK